MKGRPALRRFMFCCLLFGQAWAGYVIVRFAAKPHSTLALPFTNGQGDYLANPDVMAIANEVAERVRRGERHAFVYGYETRAENTTDPAGLPERLLLMLGPRAFSDHIRFVSSGECTYSCVPRSPPSRLREAIVEIGVEFLHVPFEPNCARTPAMPLVKRMLDWHGVRYVDAPALFQSFDTLRITEILGRSRETGQAATAPNGRSSPRPRLCLLSFPTDLDPAPEHLAGSDKAKLMFPLNMYDGFFEYGSRSHASRLSPGNRLVLTGEIESEKPFRNVLFQIRADRGLSIHVNGEKVRVERDERSECTLGEAVLATGTNRMTIHDTGFSTSNWITLLTRYENGEIPDWTCR